MVKLIVRNVKAEPLGKLMECRVNRLNISQMGLCGFKLATNHQCDNWSSFETANFSKNVHIEKSIKSFFLRVDWVSNRINMWYHVPRRKNFDFIFICSEATAQTSWRGSSLFQSIASRYMTQRKKCDDFWLPGAKSFPIVYIMNDFASIIFRRYYTLIFITDQWDNG